MEEREVLESWKEIAAYLKRSVMTCHRWEEELGLPIHRLDGTPRARVFAYTDELDRWMAEKIHEHEAEARVQKHPRVTKRTWIAAGGVFFAAAVAAVGWLLLQGSPAPAPAEVPTLAVLPFENQTGDETWDPWRKALPDLLTIDLRQSKFLDVIKTSNLYQAAGALVEAEKFSPEDIQTIAQKARVDFVLTGNFIKSGRDVVFASLVHDGKTGEIVASPRSECRTERDVFSRVDDLSRKIKSVLNVKPREIRRDIDKPAAMITTNSPEAFKLYSQGYRVQGKLKFDEAIAPFLRAVEIDPDFGLAYRGLYHYCRAMSREADAKKYGEMAVRLADRLEERERNLFLEDFYSSEKLDSRKAIQALERLGKNYPYDLTMSSLAVFYRSREEWEKALPILEKLYLRPENRQSLVQELGGCYQALGRYDKAEKVLDDLAAANPAPGPNQPFLLTRRIRLAIAQGKFDLAHSFADELIASGQNPSAGFSWKGYIFLLQDDFANAEKAYQKFADADNPRIRMDGLRFLASVSLTRGRVEEAKQRIRQGIEISKSNKRENEGPDVLAERSLHYCLAYLHRLTGDLPEALKEADLACSGIKGLMGVNKLHLKAWITLEMGRAEEFEKLAEEIKVYTEADRFPLALSGYPRLMRVHYHLLGHRELQKKNFPLAIEYFWKALDHLSVFSAGSYDADHAKYFFDLAETYRLSGNLTAALPMYEKIILPTVGREFSGDQYAKSYYGMGLYYERLIGSVGTSPTSQDRRAKAIGYYRKFLEIWKDADPIFPEVEDAKQRLAKLEAR